MDNHDKAHYGIGAALLAGVVSLGGLVYEDTPASYPSLKESDAIDVITAAYNAIDKTKQPKDALYVLCGDPSCKKIAKELVYAGATHDLNVKSDVLLSGSDNISVGAPTGPEADAIKKAVESASGGKLQVAFEFFPHQQYYISFGAIVSDK